MSAPGRDRQVPSSARRDVLRVAGFGLAYFVFHSAALLAPDSGRVLATIWPAGGVSLAALLLSRRGLWPAMLAVFFAAGTISSVVMGRTIGSGAGFMIANVVESAACAWVITRVCGEGVRFVRVREVLALAIAATLVNAGSATLGAGAGALTSSSDFAGLWRTWWVVDGLGILLVTPLIVTWWGAGVILPKFRWRGAVEWSLFLATWCWVGRMSFEAGDRVVSPHPYMLVALMAWPAFRFGQRGVTAGMAILSVIVLTCNTANTGVLHWGVAKQGEELLSLQVFLAFTAFAGMLLAAVYEATVTARDAAEETSARLRALGNNLPGSMVYQLVLELDGSRRFQYASAGCERLNGYTAEQLLEDPQILYGSIVEEDRPRLKAAQEASVREMGTLRVNLRMRRGDGAIRWMEFSSSPRRLADGRILWDGLQLDVTEAKRAEQAQRESEQRYRVLVENTELPVMVVSNPGGKILFANETAAEFAGYSCDELIGEQIARFWSDASERERALEILKRDERLAGFEVRFVTRSGASKWAKVGASLIDYGGEMAILAVFGDITRLKVLHKRLEAERTFLKALIDTIPEMVWMKDLGGVFVICNPATERMLGFKESELIGRTDFDIFPREDAEGYRQRDREALANGPSVAIERVRRKEDGRDISMETMKLPMRDSSGELIGVMGIARDISATLEAEELLREQVAMREQMATTAAMLPGAIYSYRMAPDGHASVPYASSDFGGLLGVTTEEVKADASRIWGRLHPDDAEGVHASIAESARTLTEWQHAFRIVDPTRGEVWLGGRSRPMRSEDGGIIWHGYVADVTERKRAELALEEEATRRRILIEESKDGIAVLDLSGRLREWNASFARMLGYDAREMGGLSVWDWDDIWTQALWLESLREGARDSATFESRHRRKDGSTYEVEISASGAEVGGERLIFCVQRDITTRRRAEEERDALQAELQEARRLESLGVLAGGLAHEYNNLLTVINGYAELLRNRFEGEAEVRDEVAAIQRAGQRAAELTEQLVAYGRKTMISPRALSLNVVIEEGRRSWEGLLGRGVEVRTELEASLKGVSADPEQVAEVIAHLLRNAAWAMPNGGTVTLATANVEIGEEEVGRQKGARAGSFVKLTVTDTGCGMDEETRGRIFEPFFTTRERALASGMGLATVHGLVAQHQGWIGVDSAPGEGASFRIYLPAVDAVEVGARLFRGAAGHWDERRTVLVVDDEEEVRELAVTILKARGYRTLEASSGREAIAIAESHREPIDLLVTDVVMPGMTGPELAGHMKTRLPQARVVYVSGYPEEILGQCELPAEEVFFVRKPYTLEALMAKVREALGG
ncbi:MAG: PAS domain S-box protein [Bryobacterales bacterium]|nr:PAS domain S-box protein [Bryobacterales bacterium]